LKDTTGYIDGKTGGMIEIKHRRATAHAPVSRSDGGLP
jgi:hypothetical protein